MYPSYLCDIVFIFLLLLYYSNNLLLVITYYFITNYLLPVISNKIIRNYFIFRYCDTNKSSSIIKIIKEKQLLIQSNK